VFCHCYCLWRDPECYKATASHTVFSADFSYAAAAVVAAVLLQ
jgi:hypothetical protein